MYRAFWRGNDSHNEFSLRRSDAGGISKYVQDIFRSGGIKTIHHRLKNHIKFQISFDFDIFNCRSSPAAAFL